MIRCGTFFPDRTIFFTFLVYQINFFKWIADYYMCPLGKVFETALPKLFLIKSETIIEILSKEVGEDLSEKAKNLFYHLAGFDEISLNDIDGNQIFSELI